MVEESGNAVAIKHMLEDSDSPYWFKHDIGTTGLITKTPCDICNEIIYQGSGIHDHSVEWTNGEKVLVCPGCRKLLPLYVVHCPGHNIKTGKTDMVIYRRYDPPKPKEKPWIIPWYKRLEFWYYKHKWNPGIGF